MRKLMLGAGILAALLVGTIFNAKMFDDRVGELSGKIESASSLLASGSTEEGLKLLENTAEEWDGFEGYTHIFMRQGEIDAVCDAFYDYLGSVRENGEDNTGARDRLLYRLDIMARSEKLRLGSIF